MNNRKTITEKQTTWLIPENNRKYLQNWHSQKVVEIILKRPTFMLSNYYNHYLNNIVISSFKIIYWLVGNPCIDNLSQRCKVSDRTENNGNFI